MKRRQKIVFALCFSLAVLLTIAAIPAFSQNRESGGKPLIVLTEPSFPVADTAARTLASTVTRSLDLILTMTGSVQLQRADFLTPDMALEHAIKYYREAKAEDAVYGSVEPTNTGEYLIVLKVWKASTPNGQAAVVEKKVTAATSSSTAAYEVSLRAASAILGTKLSEGTLVIQNVSNLPKYSVYANGILVGRNRPTFHVLTGRWTVIVARPGQVGDLPIQAFHVDIEAGATTIIALSETAAGGGQFSSSSVPKPASPVSGALQPTNSSVAPSGVSSRPGLSPVSSTPATSSGSLKATQSAPSFSPPPILVRVAVGSGEGTIYVFQGKPYAPGFLSVYPGLANRLGQYSDIPTAVQLQITNLKRAERDRQSGLTWLGVGGALETVGLLWLESAIQTSGGLNQGQSFADLGLLGGGGIGIIVGIVNLAYAGGLGHQSAKNVVSLWNGYAK